MLFFRPAAVISERKIPPRFWQPGIERPRAAVVAETCEPVDDGHPAAGHAGCVYTVRRITVNVRNVHAHCFTKIRFSFLDVGRFTRAYALNTV